MTRRAEAEFAAKLREHFRREAHRPQPSTVPLRRPSFWPSIASDRVDDETELVEYREWALWRVRNAGGSTD